MNLNFLDEIPSRFFDIEIEQILDVFSGPTIIHLKGQNKDPLFISTLLHGNETTSFYVLQSFLKDKDLNNLNRDLIIFIGNVSAASKKQRMLENQPDFNRIWSPDKFEEVDIAQKVIEYSKKFNIFASIDIHNNTGNNPYYACINRIENRFISLASLFAPYIVYFTEPHEVQSMAFAKFTPSVTLECGTPGKAQGISYVTEYLNKVYSLNELPEMKAKIEELNIFQTKARIILKENIKIDYLFDETTESDISLRTDIDDFNFTHVQINETLGHTKNIDNIRVIRNDNVDVTDEYLSFDENKIVIKRDFIPSMLTTDAKIAVSDCLGYIMQREIEEKK